MREPHIIKPVRFSEVSVSKSITQVDRYESASVVDASNRNVHCWILSGNADRIEGLSFRRGSEEEHAIFADCSEMIARMLGVVSLELDGLFSASKGLHPECIELAEKDLVFKTFKDSYVRGFS